MTKCTQNKFLSFYRAQQSLCICSASVPRFMNGWEMLGGVKGGWGVGGREGMGNQRSTNMPYTYGMKEVEKIAVLLTRNIIPIDFLLFALALSSLLEELRWRNGMVGAFGLRIDRSGFEAWPGHYVVFSGKTLNSLVPLATQVHKWVPGNTKSGDNRWTSIPSRWSRNTPCRFMPRKSE